MPPNRRMKILIGVDLIYSDHSNLSTRILWYGTITLARETHSPIRIPSCCKRTVRYGKEQQQQTRQGWHSRPSHQKGPSSSSQTHFVCALLGPATRCTATGSHHDTRRLCALAGNSCLYSQKAKVLFIRTRHSNRRGDQRQAAIHLKRNPAAEYQAKSKLTFTTSTIWCIRANQGHSIPGIDPEALLTRLSPEELAALPVVVHGTFREAWKAIHASGYLSIMKRHHIHFAAGLLGEQGVISGMRRTCQIYVYIDAGKCARDGIVFFRSDNGVLLTAGIDGKLLLKYVSHVTDEKGNLLLEQRGKN